MEGYREMREIYTNDVKKIFIKHFLTAQTQVEFLFRKNARNRSAILCFFFFEITFISQLVHN